MKLRIILFLYLFTAAISGFGYIAHGDSVHSNPGNNAVFITAGTMGMYSVLSGNFEWVIFHPYKSIFSAVGIRISGGCSFVWYWSRDAICYASIYTLIGRKNNYLDIGTGLFLGGPSRDDELFPSFNLNYRHRMTRKPFIIRLGIGWPEVAHLSFGVCF